MTSGRRPRRPSAPGPPHRLARSETSYVGGDRASIYIDIGTLPPARTDPSAGSVVNLVPTVTTGNFNSGVKPALPSNAVAAGPRRRGQDRRTTGALVVFIR